MAAAAAARPAETVLAPIKESPPLPGFEGPEKTIEIDFVPGVGPADGLRAVTRESWDAILAHAACTILVEHRAPTIDAYVLSESSLFVMSHKLLIKTCGTTTLLLVLPEVLKAAEVRRLEARMAAASAARRVCCAPGREGRGALGWRPQPRPAPGAAARAGAHARALLTPSRLATKTDSCRV